MGCARMYYCTMRLCVVLLALCLSVVLALPTESIQQQEPQLNLGASAQHALELLGQLQALIAQHSESNTQVREIADSEHFLHATQLVQQLQQSAPQVQLTPAQLESNLKAAVASIPALAALVQSNPQFSGMGSRPMAPDGKSAWFDCKKADYAPALAAVLMRLGGENWTSTLPILMFYLHTLVYYIGCLLFG
eukprot:c23444_g1_i1.p1 GENE.c23444_g1_i1~~c23444_g1_i1.p1  ORF type:complete len:192 (+),score=46.28 c23444_g1_i1:1-576(+)